MNKILILGFNGMLGTMVSEYFEDLHEFEVYKTSRRIDSSNLDDKIYKFDVSQDSLENLIEVTKPNYVINCIGVIKPDIDEKNINSVKAAININSYFPIQIASLSKDFNFKYIQIGTDCVFSGQCGNYDESSFQDASDVYGKTKVAGEIEQLGKFILRGSIVGPELGEGKSLLNWFLSEEGGEVSGFSDHSWNGITTLNFAKIIHGMIKNNNFKNKINHIIPKDKVSKFELLNYFKIYFDVDVQINETSSKQVVDRTLNTLNISDNLKLWNDAGYEFIPTIEENIKELSESNITRAILNRT